MQRSEFEPRTWGLKIHGEPCNNDSYGVCYIRRAELSFCDTRCSLVQQFPFLMNSDTTSQQLPQNSPTLIKSHKNALKKQFKSDSQTLTLECSMILMHENLILVLQLYLVQQTLIYLGVLFPLLQNFILLFYFFSQQQFTTL